MQLESKSQEQLVEDVAKLRQRVAELKALVKPENLATDAPKNHQPRLGGQGIPD